MDVGEEDIAGVAQDANVILDVQRDLEVISPVLSRVTVVRENRVCEEDPQSIKIRAESIKHDDIRRDHEEVPR